MICSGGYPSTTAASVRRSSAFSGVCFATAAGPGGAIVPVGVGSQTAARERAAPPCGPRYCQDAAHPQTATGTAWSCGEGRSVRDRGCQIGCLCRYPDDLMFETPFETPLPDPFTPPASVSAHRPGAWGNRLASLPLPRILPPPPLRCLAPVRASPRSL